MIAGVDPGNDGAVAILQDDGGFVRVYDMPMLTVEVAVRVKGQNKKRIKHHLDEAGLRAILVDNLVSHVFTEKAQVMPADRDGEKVQGIVSMGNYMKAYGQILGICAGLQIPKQEVHPASWKAKMMADMPRGKGSSIVRCKQLFPGIACLERKKDDGRAEAILVGLYGIRYFLQGGESL